MKFAAVLSLCMSAGKFRPVLRHTMKYQRQQNSNKVKMAQ